MNERAVAAALREVSAAFGHLAAAVEGNVPGQDYSDRGAELLRCFAGPDGLSGPEAIQAFREHGFNARGMGSWVQNGKLVVDARGADGRPSRYCLGAKGREALAEDALGVSPS